METEIFFPYPKWTLNFRTHCPWTCNTVVSWNPKALTFTVPEPDGWHTFSWLTVLASTPRTGRLFSIPRVLKPPLSISCGPWLLVHHLTEPPLPKVFYSIRPYCYGQPQVPPLNSNLQPNVSLPNLQLGTAAVPEGWGDEGINEHMVAIETPVTRLLHALVFSRPYS